MPTLFDEPSSKPPRLVGGRWLVGLSLALLAGYGGIALLRSLPVESSERLETVVQLPVPPDNAPPERLRDQTGPDPGD